MPTLAEQLEVLKAVIAVAVADGRLTKAEWGVVKGLAARVGIAEQSLETMVERAKADQTIHEEIDVDPIEGPESAVELLVGLARIDGDIAPEERARIAEIAGKLGITGERFGAIYLEGVKDADRLRAARHPGR